jgi:hypothetical protein
MMFSDGLGRAGGINFHEARANFHKAVPLMSGRPDTSINPSDRVAFYDPGLGSASGEGHIKIG